MNGGRDHEYGSPENNFDTVARFWTTYLDGRSIVCGSDVAAMLALLKIARISSGQKKADNWIDLAGYAACGGEIEDTFTNGSSKEFDDDIGKMEFGNFDPMRIAKLLEKTTKHSSFE